MVKLEISLKRVQTFIFEVPRLRAMLGANALIGQTMRHELPKLIGSRGKPLDWPAGLGEEYPDDPLHATVDPDDPAALYGKGILARDGGHFIAVFENEPAARDFLHAAEEQLAQRLPGVLYEVSLERKAGPRETQLMDLPVLQVCQETGRGPASEQEKERWQARSVTHRQQWGDRFYAGGTKDIIGLMRSALYPDKARHWSEPDDLAQLAAGGYLALIHADGNGIGKRYNAWKKKAPSDDPIDQEAHGEAFFHSMRVAVRRAVVAALTGTFTTQNGKRPYEILMLGGDDLLLLCRANQALEFGERYARELTEYRLADGPPLNVAIGIAIAQQSYPLHRLHELAESLASSAKRLYRALPDADKTSVIDWQVVTPSWFEGVAEARRQGEQVAYTVGDKEETLLLTGRPYRVSGAGGLEGLSTAARRLDAREEGKAARSPLRGLRGACEGGRLMGEMAFARLPKDVQTQLGWAEGKLWEPLGVGSGAMYATRALDIIGIREIAGLGSKKND
ncbi:hypothetical protein [uncultured Thiodictyon sp.]|uniref:Cas10/Cmr2 second palm domain-containing protein n=1 Tax=uncultured Thiodictyon sp. TaxID=1846217 RepID=UPI0025D7F2A9|nr:hypothetical protein [uncultured Thiodictyon sp.]